MNRCEGCPEIEQPCPGGPFRCRLFDAWLSKNQHRCDKMQLTEELAVMGERIVDVVRWQANNPTTPGEEP